MFGSVLPFDHGLAELIRSLCVYRKVKDHRRFKEAPDRTSPARIG
jgi:hypothetical protein